MFEFLISSVLNLPTCVFGSAPLVPWPLAWLQGGQIVIPVVLCLVYHGCISYNNYHNDRLFVCTYVYLCTVQKSLCYTQYSVNGMTIISFLIIFYNII